MKEMPSAIRRATFIRPQRAAIVTMECTACGSKVEMSYADFKATVPTIDEKFMVSFTMQCVNCLSVVDVRVREEKP